MIHMLYKLPCGKTLKEIKQFGLSEERQKIKDQGGLIIAV